MQKRLLLWCLLFPVLLNGQTHLSIQVRHAQTGEALAFAHVFLKQARLGDATDLAGKAVLTLESEALSVDTLVCSYVGFRDTLLPVKLPFSGPLIIDLTPRIVALAAVEVTGRARDATGEELVSEAVKTIKHNYPRDPAALEAFYRERVYENSRCVWLNEALADLYYTSYPQKGYVKRSFRRYYAENFRDIYPARRECKKMLFVGHPQYFKYYNTAEDQCRIRTSRKSRNWGEEARDPIVYGGPLALTAADKVKYLADFFDPRLMPYYEYRREEARYLGDRLCITVRFQPKRIARTRHQRWDRKVSIPLFSGALYVDSETFAIVRFECQFAPSARIDTYRLIEPWQIFPTVTSVEVNYIQYETGRWRLNSVETRQFYRANSSLKWEFKSDYECVRELLIIEMDTENARPFDAGDPNLLPDCQYASLRDLPAPYRPEAWEAWEQKSIYPPLSTEERASLERKEPLRSQFLANE